MAEQAKRQEYKKHTEGKPSHITQERINELTAIGVEWCPRKAEKLEEDKLSSNEIASEDEMTPAMTRTVRCSRTTRSEPVDRHSCFMAHTVSTKRSHSRRLQSSHQKCRRLNNSSRTSVTLERHSVSKKNGDASIDKAGIQEERNPAQSVSRRSSRRTMSERPQSANIAALEPTATATTLIPPWEEYFDRLVQFKFNRGHCRVPLGFCVDKDYYLGHWVVVQRLQHNRLADGRPSSITAEQVEQLNSIGFVWKVR